MVQLTRRTVIAPDRLAMRELRLAAARKRGHGLQVMTFEQLAARMAGGLLRPVDDEALRTAVQDALPLTGLGELDALKALPGMVGALVDTLKKVWRAGVDLQARRDEHPRIAALAAMEVAVLGLLPPAMIRPADLVAAAMQRLQFAPNILGSLRIIGITELAPCWRTLLKGLAQHIEVQWEAGPRSAPGWLGDMGIEISRSPPQTPEIVSLSAATAYHEAVEALRWARELIASGQAAPSEIAIAAVTPSDYDDHLLALRADANLDLHFVHGVPVTTTRDGQAASALADILTRGLSQTRLRRLAAHLSAKQGPLQGFPDDWLRVLPSDAPLASPTAWERLLSQLGATQWSDGVDHTAELRKFVDLLLAGVSGAGDAGEALLQGRALAIWRKALLAGPVASIGFTIEAMRLDDGLEASVSLAWMPASAIAATPRAFVRLLGLNSSRWPRGLSEDRLLSEHIIPGEELDPLPAGAADRRDFETILLTTTKQVVLSRARRDSDGRLLGRSPLLTADVPETYLRRNRTPAHAFSETDRLTARPGDFRSSPAAQLAETAWRDWRRETLTAHDGLVRADHPLLHAVADRIQSASSLRLLLRNPLGFVWKYGLHLTTPESSQEPLVIDALGLGELVHQSLDTALRSLEANGGFAAATAEAIAAAVESAVAEAAAGWETNRATPPLMIWRRTLADVRDLATAALAFDDPEATGGPSFSEVPFGGAEAEDFGEAPWDAAALVEIPGTGFRIRGYIDRLDISQDRLQARVCDYKTGRAIGEDVVLNGGKELQRCLYAYAVKALLGDKVEIAASLLFLREGAQRRLMHPDETLAALTTHLGDARASLLAGAAVIGPDAGGDYDDLAFALPANAKSGYAARKLPAATERLGDAALIWDAA